MKYSRWLLLAALASVAAASNVFSQTARPLVLTHVTVIETFVGRSQTDQTVLITGSRITALGPTGSFKLPKNATLIEARGKFLIPGLWDMHVHLAGVSADPAWSKQVFLPLLIANGITGVRDMGGDLEALLSWRHDIEAGILLGPHIIAAGPWLSASGQKSQEQYPVANAEAARAAVRNLKQRGADFIKILTLPSRETFFAVADEAKRQGLRFSGHIPNSVTASEASDAGIQSIEHIVYSSLALDCSSREDELRKAADQARMSHDQRASAAILPQAIESYSPEKAAALWARFKRNGTWVVPTLASVRAILPPRISAEQQAQDPQLDFVPQSLRKKWDPRSPENRISESAEAWWTRQFANDFKLAGEMHRAGVAMLAGSDSLDRFVFPGESLHQELQLLQDVGFTPIEALQAATRDPAVFLGREMDFGGVAVGRIADLVLLDANPMDDVANARKISAVIRGGQFLDRAALDLLLAQARAAAKAVPVN